VGHSPPGTGTVASLGYQVLEEIQRSCCAAQGFKKH
jgi:hypothetical protein